ncbi:MAG TPA: glycosyltransferase family 4 protein, partial [Ferruginibacter sp.]|nr:glycosyltransferase family 4 protein [Ferruginibacter sp.]
MKILHVLYSGLGGHGNIFFAMVNADAKKEFEYEALFYGIEEVRDEFIEQCEKQHIPWYFSKKHVKLDLKYYIRIMQFIRKSNPDVVFLHGSAYILPARLAALFSKKRTRIIVRETQANHLKTKAQWVSLTGAMFLASRIVCLTEEFRQQIQKKLGWLYRGNKVQVISNGINLDVYKPGNKTQGTEVVIGMQSRLVRIKDHLTLLKAFAILKNEHAGKPYDLKLRIAGDGDFKDELVKFADTLGLGGEVEFTGMIPEKELVGFLQSLDIYVHASLGETMSTAIMQAMACKLPVIASDVNGINNMITHLKTGILVPPKNEEELARALADNLVRTDLRDKMAQNA